MSVLKALLVDSLRFSPEVDERGRRLSVHRRGIALDSVDWPEWSIFQLAWRPRRDSRTFPRIVARGRRGSSGASAARPDRRAHVRSVSVLSFPHIENPKEHM